MFSTQQHIDRINYVNDARTQEAVEVPEIDGIPPLPTCYEVCNLCHGEGTHVNPSIDAGGLDHEAMDDPDFMADYRAGHFDVQCNACKGLRVLRVVDEDRLTKQQREAWEEWQQDEANYHAERLAEMRMGA